MCGQCCNGYGGTFVTESDVRAIAKYINIDPEKFVDKYCSYSGKRPLLSQKADGYCIFFDKLCTIHPVKPHMCRQWPYLPSVLVDIQNWHTMAVGCPGIKTNLADDVIKLCVRRKLAQRQAI